MTPKVENRIKNLTLDLQAEFEPFMTKKDAIEDQRETTDPIFTKFLNITLSVFSAVFIKKSTILHFYLSYCLSVSSLLLCFLEWLIFLLTFLFSKTRLFLESGCLRSFLCLFCVFLLLFSSPSSTILCPIRLLKDPIRWKLWFWCFWHILVAFFSHSLVHI